MKRGGVKSISELVKATCREEGLETPLNEYRLINSWSQVLGPTVKYYTKELCIRNQVLYVQVTSSVLRQELMMNRKTLVHRLNEHVGAQVITDIVLR
jgi:predicted nucleic acid-binding Zn ribbon protein